MENVNMCSKNIGLWYIFKTFYGKEKKLIFFSTFYIFHERDVKTFFKLFLNNWSKGTN